MKTHKTSIIIWNTNIVYHEIEEKERGNVHYKRLQATENNKTLLPVKKTYNNARIIIIVSFKFLCI